MFRQHVPTVGNNPMEKDKTELTIASRFVCLLGEATQTGIALSGSTRVAVMAVQRAR